MPETVTLGPLANLTPSTGWGQPQRVHRDQTGSNAAFAIAPRRTTWYNCFDATQIPLTATITGVEFVLTGSTGSNGFGTAGSTGAAEEATFDIRAWNGTSYSSVIYTYTAVGANDYVAPTIGDAADLHGLSWSPADQADFGFDIDLSSVVATPVAVVIRGCAMKVHYLEAGAGGGSGIAGVADIHGASTASLAQVNGVSAAAINSINGI